MPFYEVSEDKLDRRDPTTFHALGMYERGDIQRLLLRDISPLGDDLLVISEEFGQWEDARRRIDLLAVDRLGHLVVIELKRTEDGGHMDLQSLRYAAMVSSMDFSEVLATFEAHRLKNPVAGLAAQDELEAFLDASNEADEPAISSDVRIMLVSADFGREITTAVLWLNRFEGMDIRCVRLIPYTLEHRTYIDIQQVIPLPESADYQVRVRRKEAERERSHVSGKDFTRYQIVVDGNALPEDNKRNAVRTMVEQLVLKGLSPESIRSLMASSKWVVLDGAHPPGEGVASALEVAYPRIDIPRWFVEHPFFDEKNQKTYVLSKMWGRQTEHLLDLLSSSFADSGVSYRRASEPTGQSAPEAPSEE